MSGWTNSTVGAPAREIVDTNVLIYAADLGAGVKHVRVDALMRQLAARGVLAVSVQILNEFYWNATRPNKPPSLSHDDASQTVRDLIASAEVYPLTPSLTLLALDIIPRHSLSFWDALIWAAAKENGVAVIHTEDSQDGRVVEGVLYHNPFAATP